MSWLRPSKNKNNGTGNAPPSSASGGAAAAAAAAPRPLGSHYYQQPQQQQQQQQQQQRGTAPTQPSGYYQNYDASGLRGHAAPAGSGAPTSATTSSHSLASTESSYGSRPAPHSSTRPDHQQQQQQHQHQKPRPPQGQPSSSAVPQPAQLAGSGPSRKTGVLVIRVIEARDLTPPATSQHLLARYAPYRNDIQQRPYAVVEFDRNEVAMAALGGDMRNPVWRNRAHFDVSRSSPFTVSLYQRTAEVLQPRPPLPTQQNRGYQRFGAGNSGNQQQQQQQQQQRQDNNSGLPTGSIFLGSVRIMPDFVSDRLIDEWLPLFGSSGSIHIQYCFNRKDSRPLSVDDFELLKVIGKGSFGKVMQVRKRDTNRIYAMKILSKSKIVMRSEVAHTLAERTVLARINHPFIVPLKFSFQTPQKLYFVLAFINGGELFHHLQNEGRFDQNRSRFYAAELLSALECLHSYNVIYRDLKPENILLDFNGHIALCDFGLCKLDMSDQDTTNTFCGTPEYLAPELLHGNGYTKSVDWWTFGVLLYEMLTGLPPFYHENVNEMYRRILEDPLVFPEDMGTRARALLRGLLDRNPVTRLGNNGAAEIKQQPFFAEIDWDLLLNKKYEPPFQPNISSAIDTSNFDEEFTSEMPQDSYIPDSHLSETVQEQFIGFTYDGSGGAMSLAQSMNLGGDGFRQN